MNRLPRNRSEGYFGSDRPPGALPVRTLPRYKVILHRGDQGLMFVVRTVMEVTRFGRAEATHRMWEAHHNGQSLVLVTYFERAEFYTEQFRDRGLNVSMEPA